MRIVKTLVLVFFALGAKNSLAKPFEEEDNWKVALFSNEIQSWAQSGYRTNTLEQIISELALPDELQRIDWRTFTGEQASGICTICKSIAKSVIALRQNGTTIETIQDTIVQLCTKLNLYKENVCNGAVKLNTPIIMYIMDSDPTISPSDVCGLVLQSQSCSTTSDKYDWTIEIDQNPKSIESQVTEETVKIIQITDIHYDPLYEPSGNAHCQEPTCCRRGQNITNDNNGAVAGYWGDYNYCDTPWHAVVDALTHIKDAHEETTTYIYYTGDIIDHGVWETSKEGNIESLTKSYNEIKITFGDIPVYPILGNHEPHPLNVFAPENIVDEGLSTRWLYELLADLWISYGWLPESTRETILRGGFYTLSPQKGFRIIALNNNVCYTYNWWLIYDPQDPGGQLRWLADTLLEAELNGEYVHILAHIPPGNQACYVIWSREYIKIVTRFAHIITGQFNGHTHCDELNIFYDPNEPNNAINVAWNGGSITPWSNLNPNYKVYEANANTFAIEQVSTWIYNLTAANEKPGDRPVWYKSYTFKEEYGLQNLSLPSLNQWILDMASNTTMLENYRNHFHKHAEPSLGQECGTDCMEKYLCEIVTTNARDKRKCNELTSA